ncbi:DNA-binding protein [Treponema primitia ZAS-2]|uniref:DNA-binding protein n=1 Tax=Treponema primitia (strain ATCC BAA-887 / DSM 12427 / ZAS-2) TaxID=545694 RepID=F5YKT4_TREPZ|nr:helix-turn-helix transcriptional regulator [Treponema primitia]AEF85296.1 DNA-binding protein [Treponema primitia ZAS-2]
MTHFQEMFIKNLRYFRKLRGLSQLKFSELIDVSPNYLNAVENGKNFPSPELMQRISDRLEILPYQLFLEFPLELHKLLPGEKNAVIHELAQIRQKFIRDIDEIIEKYGQF